MDAHDTHDRPCPKKNQTLNTLGIITVGAVGSVLVYVSIIALQALYLSETSPIATQKNFGQQGNTRDDLKAAQLGNISDAEPRTQQGKLGHDGVQLFSIGIENAKRKIIEGAADPSRLVPPWGWHRG